MDSLRKFFGFGVVLVLVVTAVFLFGENMVNKMLGKKSLNNNVVTYQQTLFDTHFFTDSKWNSRSFVYVVNGDVVRGVDVVNDSGEKIAYADVAVEGSYFDKKGKKQKVLIATYVRLPDGVSYVPGSFPDNLNEDDLEESLRMDPKRYQIGISGGVFGGSFVSDFDTDCEMNKQEFLGAVCLPYGEFIKKYNLETNNLLRRFLEEGDPSIRVVIPTYQLGTGKVIELGSKDDPR